MAALYNEIDSFAAPWLRNLIAKGHIADGRVDERSIKDLTARDLDGFKQCHFFAGIGVWSYALRLAGWPDDLEVWTGSCPCQPFSTAGKRGGKSDERHLWPDWFRLIDKRRPAAIFGEQVASPDGLAWFDDVSADLERAGYAVCAADLCAAGIGAPHIRQRLYFAAFRPEFALGLAVPVSAGRPERGTESGDRSTPGSGGAVRLADTDNRDGGNDGRSGCAREQDRCDASGGREASGARAESIGGDAGATRGAWAGAVFLPCRDGRWRPVEPGTFPLAHGAPARVGRLRGYGNAIVSEVAATFIEAATRAVLGA